MKVSKHFLLVWLIGILFQASAFAQNGSIKGKVIDAETKEPVFGANVYIQTLSKGDVTNFEGEYTVKNVPPGDYQVRFSYLSYQTENYDVRVEPGQEVVLDIELRSVTVQGEEVVVLAQAQGQAAAIKQQLESNTIVNVVSKERIQENPDQNAAESVARLPGVSVTRDAGEASKVVVRGLSPRFNSITVNGVRLPGTDPDDRSVDLSLIPPEVLDGIEVFKALTPDKDADAVGGTVNLLVKSAPAGFKGEVRMEGGYNDLTQTFQDYKGGINLSNRFFNNKLGVLFTGSAQQVNRTAHILDAQYLVIEETQNFNIEDLNLTDNQELRDRYGLGLNLDYSIGNNEFFFNSFMGRTDRDELRVRKRYRVENTRTEYDLRERDRFSQVYSNSLRGEHVKNQIKWDWQLSNSFSLNKTPFSNFARFEERAAYDPVPDGNTPLNEIPSFALNNLDNTSYLFGTNNFRRTADRDITAQANMKIAFRAGEDVGGYLKFGGKYWDKQRSNNEDEIRTRFGTISSIGQNNPDLFDLTPNGDIRISNFIDQDYDPDPFRDSQGFLLSPGLSSSLLRDFAETYEEFYDTNRVQQLRDYEAGETITSAYIMTEINVGERFTFIPGVRYEHTDNDYQGVFGDLAQELGLFGELRDTTGGQSYDGFFPMFQMRFQVTEAVSFRAAYTETLSRPNFFNLVPFEQINDTEFTVSRGNPDLQPTSARNFDLFLSFFDPQIGYLSIGGFYKELENIDYTAITRVRDPESIFNGYELTQVINSEELTTIRGFEVDFQTDFRFLPKPFNGLIFNGNVAFIDSETFYPLFIVTDERDPNPPFQPVVIDTVRSGKAPDQPDFVAALTIGYEIGGFSARASLNHQDDILFGLGQIDTGDELTSSFSFWDFQVTQKLQSFEGLSVFLNVNNFTAERERSTIGSGDINNLTFRQFYGLRATMGARLRF
ncbi:MAG: TonB-dependent receptor [Bacteroidota bacterium]